MKFAPVLAVAISLSAMACARRPDAIAPAAVPIEGYVAMTCAQLASEKAQETARVTQLSSTQNNAANGDALGVFLIGVPTSSVTGGDQEGNLAVAKGKLLAIENALSAKRCP